MPDSENLSPYNVASRLSMNVELIGVGPVIRFPSMNHGSSYGMYIYNVFIIDLCQA